MTIKGRLSISNFLMIVITTVLATVIFLLGITALWMPLVQQNNIGVQDLSDFESNSTFMLTQIEGKLLETSSRGQNPKISDVAESLRNLTGYTVQVEDPSGQIWTWGDEPSEETKSLLESAERLNETGIISTGSNAVSVRHITTNEGVYEVYVFGKEIRTQHWPGKNPVKYTLIAIFVCILLAIYVANVFLTRFTFNPIKTALKTLSEGVKEIKEGNLDVKLTYDRKDEFKPVCEDFNDMAQRLKESVELVQKQEESRKELLASISHDLRSPLTSIKAYAEGLADNVATSPDMKAKYLQMILTKSNEMDRMISELFMFSKMDMGEYTYHPERINLKDFFDGFIHKEQDAYARRGAAVKINPIPEEAIIWADPFQLNRIVTNVIDNSVKYKDREAVDFTISCEPLERGSSYSANNGVIGEVHKRQHEGLNHGEKRNVDKATHSALSSGWRLTLTDNGPGVETSTLERLFDVFYRGDAARSQTAKGSGLGLAIVKKLVKRMAGRVYALHGEPRGLSIVIELPAYTEASVK